MIVWGGGAGAALLNTGGRYNPATNSWTAVTTSGSPSSRYAHTAVWTGSEMIVWGGAASVQSGSLNTGGRYNPSGNSWTALSNLGGPAARRDHTAVWTGSEMIVWGGSPGGYFYLNDGGRYNPAGNNWTQATASGAPAARRYNAAVWTGSGMLIWGGIGGAGLDVANYFNDTFSYTPDAPNADSFRITSAVLEGSDLLVSFPSVTGRSYTLWQSDTLAAGTWTDTGLSALPGTGATLTFTVLAPTPGHRFFRVQRSP